jgi:hypothetical protein
MFFWPVVVGTWFYFNNGNSLWDYHMVLLLSYTTFYSWFGLAWVVFLFQDNLQVRYNLLNALMWMKKGVYAVNWVGIMNWTMVHWEANKP